jgi:hypothetical protein
MFAQPDSERGGLIRPEDLECVSAALDLTLRFLIENKTRFDLQSARNFAQVRSWSARCKANATPYRLWAGTVRDLEAQSDRFPVRGAGR